ncbi:MAG: tRNA pseudouridine(38-40) synthase TruA [Planctomycetota bacterium]|jgi:tRNA pseudouridine38-40 synthase
MAVRNIKLTISYDGSTYHGWQIQPGFKTIQGILTEVIQDLIGRDVRVAGASRTDAGVSALGQTAVIQIDSPIPTENLPKAITNKLPAGIAVLKAVEVPQDFDVIGAVKSKLYRYTIFTGANRPVLQIRHCWHLPVKLDVSNMTAATKFLIGRKDFKSFAAAADCRQDSVRTIFTCDVARDGDWLYINTEGNGFLYNMVRNIVGTLVEVGIGRITPEKIEQILEAKNRCAAGPIAPAQGLCLMWIKY